MALILFLTFSFASAEITYGIFPSLIYLENGFFVGSQARISTVNSELDIFLGPRAAWIIDNNLMIGGSYNWNIDHPEIAKTAADSTFFSKSHYGGLEVEYNFLPFQPVHFSIYNLIGFGKLDLLLNDKKYHEEENYFIYEPGLFLKINLTDIFHIGTGITYRYISELKNDLISNTSLGGFTGSLVFKFGKF